MIRFIISAIVGLLGIGIMVLVHEGGHYIAARCFGIGVEVFSFGMGPKLCSWRHGATEFRISWLPFGGYCRMKGSDDLTRALETKSKTFGHTESGSLFSVSPWRRALVYLAGPLSNIIFAIIVYALFSMMSYSTLSDPPRIILSSDYPTLFATTEPTAAEAAGLLSGDVILTFGETEVQDFQQLYELMRTATIEPTTMKVNRNGQVLELVVTPAARADGTALFGITSYIEPVVDRVMEESPEEVAGLLTGDRIISVNGRNVSNMLDLQLEMQQLPPLLTMQVDRNGTLMDVSFIPSIRDTGVPYLNISLQSGTRVVKGLSFGKSMAASVAQAMKLVGNTFTSIGGVIMGDAEIRDSFTGPWRASMLIGNITTEGFSEGILSGIRAMLYLLGVVSVSLAVANLLPIPALDGGMIMMSLVETILHRQVSPRTYMVMQIVGLCCIMAIMAIMSFADFRYFWRNWKS